MIIKDVMTRNPICVEVDTSIVKAKEILNKNNFSKLPVVDKQKKLVGIITKNDISKVSPSDATTLDKYEISELLDKLTCGKCMTKDVITISENQIIEEAARIMVDSNIGCVPVVKDDLVIGIVTESDLFEMFTNMFCARLKGVRANFQMADKPGSLALLFSKIAELGGNIVSVVTRESEIAGNRRVTIKVLDVELEPVNKILEDCGATIIDIRVA